MITNPFIRKLYLTSRFIEAIKFFCICLFKSK
nr:MAG TPA: hypothetical protein [Caudoviricetes sp.]